MPRRVRARESIAVGAWLFAAGACSFDVSPNLAGTDAGALEDGNAPITGGSSLVPASAPTDVPAPDAGRAPTTEVPAGFGLACAGVTCPVAPGGTDQCCTSAGDIEAQRARLADRCGLDLGGGCYELEQPGVTDARCPTAEPVGAVAEEVGCCTGEGKCGTLNATQGIGCHYNPDVDQGCDQDIDRAVTCEKTGTFAIRAAVDVTWGGRNVGGLLDITDSGRGDIVILLLAKIAEVAADGTFHSTIQACSTELPAFYSSVLCESYYAQFPNDIWDLGAVPPIEATGRFQCPNPGCILTFDPVTSLIGIDLDDPNGLWPTPQTTRTFGCPAGQGLDCFPDHDADGERGITITLQAQGQAPKPADMTCASGYAYRSPPLNANPFAIFGGVRRTDRIQLGVRVRLGASGRIEADCNSGAGGGVVDFVQSRAAGCYVQPFTADPFLPLAGPNEPCTDAEQLFIDESLPIYTILRQGDVPDPRLVIDDHSPSEGPGFSLVRLGDVPSTATCADVRQAIF